MIEPARTVLLMVSELHKKFLERFPELARSCLGSNPAYADWNLDMLHLTGPHALPLAYADWELPADCLTAVGGAGDLRIPLPPPGQAGAQAR